MATQLQAIVQKDFSGGLNLAVNPYLIPRKQVWRVRNMILDEHGSLRTRLGSDLLKSSSNVVIPVRLVRYLNKLSGTVNQYLMATDGANMQLFNMDATPFTSVTTNATSFRTPQAITITDNDLIVWGHGIVPTAYNGTITTPITATAGQTVPPGAKHIALHFGSVWLWNTNNTTTTLDGPSSIRMSAVSNYGDWPNANQAFIAKDDGQVGMGLATYTIVETGISPISTLIAFKNFSAYQITGVFGASNFAIQQVKTDMGCIAPRTIQFVSGFGIIRLTHKGFALFNGVEDKLISEDIRPAIFGNPNDENDIPSIDFNEVEIAAAGQVQNPPLYVCACPVSGSDGKLTRYFVYDLVRRAWTICDFPYDISWIGNVFSGTTGDLIGGGLTGGSIYRLFGLNDVDDHGTPIGWSFRTGPITSGDPTGLLFWRRLLIDMVYPPGQALSFTTTLTGYPTTQTGTRTLNPLVSMGRTDVDILRTAPSVYATFTGTGNNKIRGLTWQVRKKPLTRAII